MSMDGEYDDLEAFLDVFEYEKCKNGRRRNRFKLPDTRRKRLRVAVAASRHQRAKVSRET